MGSFLINERKVLQAYEAPLWVIFENAYTSKNRRDGFHFVVLPRVRLAISS